MIAVKLSHLAPSERVAQAGEIERDMRVNLVALGCMSIIILNECACVSECVLLDFYCSIVFLLCTYSYLNSVLLVFCI